MVVQEQDINTHRQAGRQARRQAGRQAMIRVRASRVNRGKTGDRNETEEQEHTVW